MGGAKRIFAIIVVFAATSLGWMILGAVTGARENDVRDQLKGDVQDLWGRPQVQTGPQLVFHWETTGVDVRTKVVDGVESQIRENRQQRHERAVNVQSSDLEVALASDLRRRGLVWYSLYDVAFAGSWSYRHQDERQGHLRLRFKLPDTGGMYDDFRFEVDDSDRSHLLDASSGVVECDVPVKPGQLVKFRAAYDSRGIDQWRYDPTQGVGRLEGFVLRLTTDFSQIDFPDRSLSPSTRERQGGGWILDWRFEQLVSGYGIGMVTPTHVQPGELASQLSFSAPVSLFFFFVVLYVLATLRRIDIHPINYALLAGAFFAFHLLFAYSVDHLSVELAFALASVVSVLLVVSYLRLVVSPRFALHEAALIQVVYLIGFSLAHFWRGYTGLTVTVLGILTLFLLMQLTGRIRWSQVLAAQA